MGRSAGEGAGYTLQHSQTSLVAGKESACHAGDLGSVPGLGRSPGEGKDYPLQYSGLENSMDCIVHAVAKTERLSLFANIHVALPQRNKLEGPYIYIDHLSLKHLTFHTLEIHLIGAKEIFASPKRYSPPVLIAALFTTPKPQKEPRRPSTEERVKKTWPMYTRTHGILLSREE